ncbi:MAG TPA: SPFH domain-containing protein [Vicinamibacterales bacterium]|nr:SPFH domain-containing protein [Vicinamibacterales bacterium]
MTLLAYGVGTLVAILVAMSAIGVVLSNVRVIRENQSGLVIKRYGRPLPSGRIIALNGEAGYQARMLPPGWHAGLWRWRYKVVKIPMVVVRPREIALVVAADGDAIPAERVLARAVDCDNFQDAEAFLRGHGERGRQISFLTAGTYRINPAVFEVVTPDRAVRYDIQPTDLFVYDMPPDRVGIVTMLDGRPIPAGDLAGAMVADHDSFQRGQAFIDAGGSRGLQEEVLLSGSWNLNPWLLKVEPVPLTEIPIGYVGVVVSYVGQEHMDVSGDAFTHGDLVERGRKGVWVEALLPGKHPINTRVMKVELVPTTNIVLNWAQRTEAHQYDQRLSSINVRSKDGFSFSLDVAQIIHIGMKNAPRVISRVGSMQNLVDHVLQPTVGNYFRNSAQQVTVLDFLTARSDRQREAFADIKKAVEAYDVECIDTLIGDIVPPAELMKTQTDRKIAAEMERTYEAQREAQIKRQALERETAVANLQSDVVRSEQMVRIAEQNAKANAEGARGDANALRLRAEGEGAATRLRAEGQAAAVRLTGEGEAVAIRAVGGAKAEAYRQGIDAVGTAGYTAIQIASILGEHKVKLVPDIAVSGDGASGLANAMIAKIMVENGPHHA